MIVEIDRRSGFCFGVINAIKAAEDELKESNQLYCLGDIVHNGMEVERLEKMGLKSITKEEYFTLSNCKVLIRAHGEPPETYQHAEANNIKLIDATCPVVLTLQEKVKSSYNKHSQIEGQVVIYGKQGHAEIEGLNGQTNHNAIIIESIADVDKIDKSRPVSLYSQTTKRIEDFHEIAQKVKETTDPGVPVEIKDTICRQVSNRVPNLKKFAERFDMVLFVAGRKSSNGQYLYTICKEVNDDSYFISNLDEIKKEWFDGVKSVGICGATSTPNWLMEDVEKWIHANFS
ncbi:4-hydroxy-3-methylbut-2-enyl diphosphate reductase [Draconibacterium sp. IB214405]|uniref:4-hydroxy-3-methylbut-2-enyl diphosphate reductase n=1 Tax=Draconibacterium sp. IB214405 TaxID=3097352 RepID=UPI002A1413AC|nr:4-hydroxy-3-methylbut-2-enyl diphosphate reductase [Draconibacterium sp. IB214405]MDX8338325.1 4-hydroxy-3-methylbut-2-enyl diphosphate reductase [Draconibacterium sp. IB214405]